jgi:uncharacterized protein YecE (DUF72 family)
MRILVGTSGYSYPAWKGSFYPEDLPNAGMLRHYATRFETVEINNTFYKMPSATLLSGWAAQVPDGFRFALKASQRITHIKRLKDTGDAARAFFHPAGELGHKLGPVLFQLPPNLKRDVPRLVDFLAVLPAGIRAALEFRHESWFEDNVFAALKAAGSALCVAEAEDLATPLVATVDWGYLRLRLPDYGEEALASWAARLLVQPWKEASVFFKHEDEGKAPALALRLLHLLGSG